MRTLIGGTSLLLAVCGTAWSQTYPTKPVRLIVPFAPGGGTDLVARSIAVRLGDAFGQPVVVDNRAGAGGVIGADLVAKSQPDGYTLLMGTPGPLTINPNLSARVPYDPARDFAPISLATISPFVLVVHPGVNAANVKELLALARARPGQLNFGSAGNGSVSHLAAEQLKALARIDMLHVPYKGSSLAVTDLLGGQLQLLIENLPVVLPHVRANRFRALAVGTQKRSALAPELPTMQEAGVAGYEASTAFGVLGPARLPPALVARVSTEIGKLLQAGELRERLAAQGVEAVGSSPEIYAAHLKAELAGYARLIKSAGIRVD
jgi:tripartite-type tricarboxylate transporter receptor subunit TctC